MTETERFILKLTSLLLTHKNAKGIGTMADNERFMFAKSEASVFARDNFPEDENNDASMGAYQNEAEYERMELELEVERLTAALEIADTWRDMANAPKSKEPIEVLRMSHGELSTLIVHFSTQWNQFVSHINAHRMEGLLGWRPYSLQTKRKTS